jgi:hypothetical protein
MKKVQDYLDEFQRLGQEAFLARYDHPFLLYAEGHGPARFQSFHTRMADRDEPRAGPGALGYRDHLVLAPLTSGRGETPARMLVGRSPDRDFTIDHSSVSKRHAFIACEADKGAYRLGDAGSTNGTFLNGQPVESGMPVYVRDQSTVSFGDCDYLFFGPQGFVQLLQQLIRRPELGPEGEPPPNPFSAEEFEDGD